ncbi:MAG TPA: fibronectin type III domain-containing protein [Armatimonadota bacterium]|nr:fibronectin type III domain-containing protein [Armatimonadota bacterium]HPO71448.1 fibronectin type III domain-containing protein [Armatimonadota bacterium]
MSARVRALTEALRAHRGQAVSPGDCVLSPRARRGLLALLAAVLASQLGCASHVSRAPGSAGPELNAPTRAVAEGWQYRGMTFISWTRDGYFQPSTLVSLDQMVAHNVRWVAIIPHWFMDNKESTRIYPDPARYTPSDESVRYIIQQAHARGLKVMLKPHVDPKDGVWRGSITPTSPSAWFESYRAFILHYARIAAETGVELFSMSNELRSMTGPPYASNWRSLVADVRGVYPGKLTAAANWGPRNWAEYLRIEWWDAVDYIGVNAYFSLTGEPHPTVEMAMAGWENYLNPWGTMEHWVSDLEGISSRFGGKQILFTEIGYNSNPTAGDPWYTDGESIPDMQAQQNCVEAAFRVWANRPYMVGGFWWEWRTDPNGGGPNNTGMALNNKPAAATIKEWFGSSPQPGDTTHPSPPGGVTAQALNSTMVRVAWSPSTDNVGVTGYTVYRNGTQVGTTSETVYIDSGLSPGLTYTYRVSASDAAGNESALSAAASATTPAGGGVTGYDFEGGIQGWEILQGCTQAWSATEIRRSGSRSLGVLASGVSSGNPGYARVMPPTTLGPGQTVTAYVYVDSAATNVNGRLYIQDSAWRWVAMSPVTAYRSREWTQVAVTVPPGTPVPIRYVGLQFMALGGSFTGNIYVDDVLWDGGPGGQEPDPPRYGFETGTEGWERLERCIRIESSSAVSAEGSRSLALWLEGASASTPGYVRTRPDGSLGAGGTVMMQAYLDASNTNVVVRLYLQDATWKWVAMSPTSVLSPRSWATLTLAVPPSIIPPIQNIGLQVMTRANTGSYTGSLYVDDVRW